MSTLHTQVVSELAAGLESTIWVATIILSTLVVILVGSITALDAEIVGELAAGLESAIGVTLEDVNFKSREIHRDSEVLTPPSLLAPPVVSW